MPTQPEPSKEGQKNALALALSVGWELASFSVLGVGLGYWLDKRFGSSPWGTLVGALFGIVIGLNRRTRPSSLRKKGGAARR